MAKTGVYGPLSAVELAQIAPLVEGKPDLYNFMPTRNIPQQEAQARGWSLFFMAESCRWGHVAPRYVSNPRMCVDCHRTRAGRGTIGAKGNKEYSGKLKEYKQPERTGSNYPVPVAPRPIEPDPLEKKFIEAYARLRDFALAAKECGRHEAEFLGRLSYNNVFRAAVNQLESDNGLTRTLSLNENYEWSEDRRSTLLRVYIDTGDIAVAKAAISVSNYHFLMELENNPQFQDAYLQAEKLANRVIGEIGVSQAIKGDTRLLQRFLSNVEPERFGENSKIKMDLNVTEKLTDEQLALRFAQAVGQLGPRSRDILEGTFYELTPPSEAEASGDGGESESVRSAESNLDLV